MLGMEAARSRVGKEQVDGPTSLEFTGPRASLFFRGANGTKGSLVRAGGHIAERALARRQWHRACPWMTSKIYKGKGM